MNQRNVKDTEEAENSASAGILISVRMTQGPTSENRIMNNEENKAPVLAVGRERSPSRSGVRLLWRVHCSLMKVCLGWL